MLEFRILGPLEIRDGERDLTPRREKHRELVAALVLRAGEVVSADRLIDELWGASPPRTARSALQNYVSLVRKSIGDDVLVSRPPGYVLQITPEQIDLGRFERLVADAREAEPQLREQRLREALRLWRGRALAEFDYAPFAQIESTRLDELRVSAEEDLVEARLALGRHADVVPELEALIPAHPYRERLRGQLMLALYRSGRQADALQAYRDAREELVEGLGIEPSPALRELEQAILRQDPELAPPAPAPPPRPTEERRKTVTVLFSDVIASTAITSGLDPEATRDVMSRYFAAMRAAIEYHGGTVEKFVGDEVMAVFGVPVEHEDDALRAVRAAALMQEGLTALNEVLDRERGVRIAIRIGVNTGEVLAGDVSAGYTFVTGEAVNVGKRIEQAAAAGEILIGGSTHGLVRHAVVAEAVDSLAAFRVLGLVAGAPALARRLDAPLVNRQDELAGLQAAFECARDGRRCVVTTVLGDPGIGKTRLAREALAALRPEATVLVGRCVSYGDGATFRPLEEMVAQIGADPATLLAGEEDRELVAERIAELLGRAEGSTGQAEGFWAVRRLFGALASERPLVAVFEDVHWAEPTLLDLIEYLADQATGAPILLLCLARPELLDTRPQWILASPGAVPLRLAPLAQEHAQALIEALDGDIAPELHDRVAEIAEGNPLFVEQLLAYAREVGVEAIEAVPPSVEALLASRIDLLEVEERAVLERAAVVGREFWRGAVVDLSRPDAVPGISSQLVSLVRRGLVRPERSAVLPEDAFRFDHVLIRDVTYAGIPKELRAELHERHADWLDGQPVGSDELIGYHLEQAYRYGAELGPVGRRMRRLAADAGERLGAAGIRAWKRGDTPATINLLSRATELLPERDSFRLELLCELGGALETAGAIQRAEGALVEAHETAQAARDRRIGLRAGLEIERLRMISDPASRTEELLDAATQAIPVLETFDDARSLARAWRLIAQAEGTMRCRYSSSAEAAQRALQYYVESGWSTAGCLGDLAAALYYGLTPVPEAVERCRALLEEADLGGRANVLRFLSGLEAMTGRFAEARSLISEANAIHERLGQSFSSGDCENFRGEIELLAQDLVAAEHAFRSSYDAFELMRNRPYAATVSARLAETLYVEGRYDEAKGWSRLTEEYVAVDDVVTHVLWRAVRAKLLAREGALHEAEALGRQARRLSEPTEVLNQRARVILDLAEVVRLSGQSTEAAESVNEALSLFERKGNVVETGRTRALIAELAST